MKLVYVISAKMGKIKNMMNKWYKLKVVEICRLWSWYQSRRKVQIEDPKSADDGEDEETNNNNNNKVSLKIKSLDKSVDSVH